MFRKKVGPPGPTPEQYQVPKGWHFEYMPFNDKGGVILKARKFYGDNPVILNPGVITDDAYCFTFGSYDGLGVAIDYMLGRIKQWEWEQQYKTWHPLPIDSDGQPVLPS